MYVDCSLSKTFIEQHNTMFKQHNTGQVVAII